MKLYGIDAQVKNAPALDGGFFPMEKFFRTFLKTADKPLAVALERGGGRVCVYDTRIHGAADMYEADCFYVERLVKTLLWVRGGYRVYVCGDENICEYIRSVYSENGARAFDAATMARVYGHPFEARYLPYDEKPRENERAAALGGHTDGCRIGFDAGGSDIKVSAVVDGEPLYSEEIVWHPKINADPDYHFGEIVRAMKAAAKRLPRVDAIGISSAGIHIDNETKLASLFLKVPEELFDAKVKNIYARACRELGDMPFAVANDGDVTALAGAMSLNASGILGIAMGTSEAGGYVSPEGGITGWLNELAFAPVDARQGVAPDEWSGDFGCGVKYFSQDGVIRLSPNAGITLSEALTPAQKLSEVQKLADEGHVPALAVFDTIGCYLGHTLPYYARFYDIRHVLLLGRVTSGKGGERLVSRCRDVLSEEYPELGFDLVLPDEKSRRVGQSVAAASLPEIKR